MLSLSSGKKVARGQIKLWYTDPQQYLRMKSVYWRWILGHKGIGSRLQKVAEGRSPSRTASTNVDGKLLSSMSSKQSPILTTDCASWNSMQDLAS
ncbi:hypothetical protein AcV5_010522 [Taiwanofungus camphoratus]|nr:hypothetical protein AcV5_010522 [Antrodia cinnamomea]